MCHFLMLMLHGMRSPTDYAAMSNMLQNSLFSMVNSQNNEDKDNSLITPLSLVHR